MDLTFWGGNGAAELIIGIVLFVSSFFIIKLKEKLAKELKEFIGAYITKDILAEKMDIIKYLPTDMINRKCGADSCGGHKK